MTSRSDWHTYFLQIATVVASRSTCDRKHVGAVIVRERTILTTGYNGSIRGLPHCDDVGHQMVDGHCVRTVHAEANAIAQAARYGASLNGATLYVTTLPCRTCLALVLNTGVVRIYYDEAYGDATEAADLCCQACVELVGPVKSVNVTGGSLYLRAPLTKPEAADDEVSADGYAKAYRVQRQYQACERDRLRVKQWLEEHPRATQTHAEQAFRGAAGRATIREVYRTCRPQIPAATLKDPDLRAAILDYVRSCPADGVKVHALTVAVGNKKLWKTPLVRAVIADLTAPRGESNPARPLVIAHLPGRGDSVRLRDRVESEPAGEY